MESRTVAIAVVLAAFVLEPAEAGRDFSVNEIQTCVRENGPEKSSTQMLDVTTVDRSGGERRLAAEMLWKRFPKGQARTLIRMQDPTDIRGSAYLLIGREERADIFAYLPELRKVRRINSRAVQGSVAGTDFSYEDIEHLQRLAGSARAERLADLPVADRSTWTLAVPLDPEIPSAYERLQFQVDQDTCVVLQVDFLDDRGSLRKQMRVDPETLSQHNGAWVPHEFQMKDLVDETETRVVVDKVQVDSPLAKRHFTETALLRRGR